MSANELTIGQLAEQTGFGRETIRFYERRGLLLPARRSESGYRLYDDEAINRLHFIGHAKLLGFTLEDIRGFVGLEVDDRKSCTSVLHRVEEKLDQVHRRMKALRRIERQLSALKATCEQTQGTQKCSFLTSDS